MASPTREVIEEFQFSPGYSVRIFDTNAVQIFHGDTQIAVVANFDEALRSDERFVRVINGAKELYEHPAVTTRPGNGSDRIITVEYNELLTAEAYNAIYSDPRFTNAEAFAMFYSATAMNVPLAPSNAPEIFASAHRLDEFPANSIAWGITFRNWLLPDMGYMKIGFEADHHPPIPMRFGDVAQYYSYVRLHNFLASGSDKTLGDWAMSHPEIDLRGWAGVEVGELVKTLFCEVSSSVYTGLTSVELQKLLKFYTPHDPSAIMEFQVERLKEGVRTARMDGLKFDIEILPKATWVLSRDEYCNLVSFMNSRPSLLKHFRAAQPRTVYAVLALIANFGPAMAEDIICELAATRDAAQVARKFAQSIRTKEAYRSIINLPKISDEAMPASWLLAIAGIAS